MGESKKAKTLVSQPSCQNRGNGSMINLTNQLVFNEVLPERNVFDEMILVVEPIATDPRKGVARSSSIGTCCKEASD